MATNDINLQVINSMTQDKMNSLKNSDGKIPSLANQLIITDEEDVNLSQLRTKLLWTNPNPTASFSAQTVTFENNETFDYFLIISRYNTNIDSYVSNFGEVGKGIHITDVRSKSGSHFAMYERSVSNITQTSVTFSGADEQYTDGSFVVSNSYLIPYQIIGLKKSPAMIYTGAELNAGEGIVINNGTLSSNVTRKTLFQGTVSSASEFSLNDTLANYKFILLTAFDNFNNYVTTMIDVSTLRVHSTRTAPIGISSSSSAVDRYAEVYYVNETKLGILTPKNMSLRFVEGIK